MDAIETKKLNDSNDKNDKNTILIADDAEMNREMLALMLGDSYNFVYAENGVEAVDALRGRQKIDIVLLDINMPEMDGFEVLRVMNRRHWIEEIPVIIISASDSTEFMDEAFKLGVADYVSRPFNATIVRKKVENILLLYSNQKRLTQLVIEQVYDREKINNSLINIFANIIELRNHESGDHTLNVQIITELLLEELVKVTDKYHLTKSDIAMISSLAALHDIGKIKIPEEILNKPRKLTPEEWEIMKSHSAEGEAILNTAVYGQNSKFMQTGREITRWHHEKYDGNGYPDGLVGDEIPISAQVVSLADSYDALTSDRCYKSAFSHDIAMDMLHNHQCGVFNPILIECLDRIAPKLKSIKEDGETYDLQSAVTYVADEVLAEHNLPKENSLRRMMDNERMKKEFFMNCADGVLFEYDKLLKKGTYVYKTNKSDSERKVLFTTRGDDRNLLPLDHWIPLREELQKTSRENPYVEADTELLVNGHLMPYHARLMAIWPEDGTEYIFVVGHFTKI